MCSLKPRAGLKRLASRCEKGKLLAIFNVMYIAKCDFLNEIFQFVREDLAKCRLNFGEDFAKCLVGKLWRRFREISRKLWRRFRGMLRKLWRRFREMSRKLWRRFREKSRKLWRAITKFNSANLFVPVPGIHQNDCKSKLFNYVVSRSCVHSENGSAKIKFYCMLKTKK
jgi:hypothetical protein